MLTEKQIEAAYNQIRWRIDKVNTDYLQMVGKQIKAIGELNPSSINRLAQMRVFGANVRKIKRELAKALNISVQDVQRLLEQAAREEYAGADFLAVERGRSIVPLGYNHALQQYIQALAAQTADTFLNYSNTTNISEEYQEAVSDAIDAVSRGVTDYHSAIRAGMRKLGGSGLRVTYESGVTRRLDTAIRQNILDGTKQIAQKAQRIIGEQIGADGVELSAHPYSALDHEPAQGRQYSLAEYEKMQSGQDFQDVEGKTYAGFRRPITEWNCRHFASYIVIGVSPRRYTDEQLTQWKEANHKGCEIDGKHYTTYEASQLMRRLETKIRQQKDISNLARESGDNVLRREAQANIRNLKAKYAEVARSAGLRQRLDKMSVEGYRVDSKPVAASEESAILSEEERGAVTWYIGGSPYSVNRKLRAGELLTEAEAATVKSLDAALEKMPIYQGTVTRDMSFVSIEEFKKFAVQYAVGSEMKNPSFVSATVSDSYQEAPQVRLYIQSKSARDLRAFNPEEAEVLFQRGSRFKVISMKREGTMFVLEIEEK